MDKLSYTVLESFGIQQVKKKVKGSYICQTNAGLSKVHITTEPTDAICFQHFIKKHLTERGFPWTDRYLLTKSGQPYLVVGREVYVMTIHHEAQRDVDFMCENDVLEAIKTLARFHIAASGINTSMHEKNSPMQPSLSQTYERKKTELWQALKQARRSPRLSDFDVLFIKHAQHYSDIIQDSIRHLKKTNYTELLADSLKNSMLCHNALKEENLPYTNQGVYIINFANAKIGLQLCDLASFIQRYALRGNKKVPLTSLLEAYDRIHPLPSGAKEIVYALLLFPNAFMKIITQYYSKKRNWTPNGLLKRMEMVLAERESYEKYIGV